MTTIRLRDEQLLFERYRFALAEALRNPNHAEGASRAWDTWIVAAFPNPDDRAAIPNPRLLEGLGGAS